MKKQVLYYSITRCLAIVIFSLAMQPIYAQSKENRISQIDQTQKHTVQKVEYYLDDTRNLEFSEVINQKFETWTKDFKISSPKHRDYHIWLTTTLINDSEEAKEVLLWANRNKYSTLYAISDGDTLSYNFGFGVPQKDWINEKAYEYLPLKFGPNESKEIYLRNEQNRTSNTLRPRVVLSTQAAFDEFIKEDINRRYPLYMFRTLFSGLILFLALFTLTQHIQHKGKSYLYYTGYLIAIFLYFIEVLEKNNHIHFIYSYLGFTFETYYLASYFIMLFYTLFTIEFLNLKETLPRLHRFAKTLCWIIIAAFLVHFIFYAFDIMPSLQINAYFVFRQLMNIPFILFVILVAYFIRSRLGLFFVIGSSFLIFGSMITMYMQLTNYSSTSPFWNDRLFYSQVGIILECLFFSAGLGYKTKKILEEKNNIQQSLILQLKENNRLQEKLASNLQEEVNVQSRLVVKERDLKAKTQFENQILELESELLQSQMNPHFIFNSLNSIKYYALTKQPEETAKYLTDFSKLMRKILQYSKSRFISLKEEIEFLNLYLSIEQRRLDYKFKFQIKLAEGSDLSRIKIPPMLLQPILENAIIHGIMPSVKDGEISILISEQDQIMITIQDNGIGRVASKKLKEGKQIISRRPMATKIAQDRLSLINQLFGINSKIELIDLYNEQEEPSGTRVIVTLPNFNLLDTQN